jgi:hypothetical protein
MVTPKSVVETTPVVVAWFKQRERAQRSACVPRAGATVMTRERARHGESRVARDHARHAQRRA